MRLCNETITVFNALFNAENDCDVYIPTVISGVSWFEDVKSTVDSSGLKAASKCTIRIPCNADFHGKTYVNPLVYNGGASVFTLKPGDIIVKGDASNVSDPRPATLKTSFPECVTVLGITDSRRAPKSKHWKVVGA